MLQSSVGDAAPAFAQAWRDKQLEYLFRRALMHEYRDFPTCTREALDFTNARFGMRLSARACETLLEKYRELPAFPDAVDGLASLKARGHRLFAFSNGHPRELVPLLEQAGLNRYLDGIVSVHPVASFKPDPAVYRHFIDSTGSDQRITWLVSGNSFDVLGASAVGWRTAWVKRDPRGDLRSLGRRTHRDGRGPASTGRRGAAGNRPASARLDWRPIAAELNERTAVRPGSAREGTTPWPQVPSDSTGYSAHHPSASIGHSPTPRPWRSGSRRTDSPVACTNSMPGRWFLPDVVHELLDRTEPCVSVASTSNSFQTSACATRTGSTTATFPGS